MIVKAGKLYNNSLWIGLNELSTTAGYVWSDGSPVGYTNWRSGQPSSSTENCVEMITYASKTS